MKSDNFKNDQNNEEQLIIFLANQIKNRNDRSICRKTDLRKKKWEIRKKLKKFMEKIVPYIDFY